VTDIRIKPPTWASQVGGLVCGVRAPPSSPWSPRPWPPPCICRLRNQPSQPLPRAAQADPCSNFGQRAVRYRLERENASACRAVHCACQRGCGRGI